jgi:predicted NBD/HSP70 family sugar kinase
MNVLVIDIGGTNVKMLATNVAKPRKFPSGPQLTPHRMVSGVHELAADWNYDVVSVGYPGVVQKGRPAVEPHNLGRGWVGFNYESEFGCPVKIMNDAAMQALGSYRGGLMLFLGLGTGLGSAIVADGVVIPLELGHLSYRKGTYQKYIGNAGLKRVGRKEWQRHVEYGAARLVEALRPDYVVIGGGNVKNLKNLPPIYEAGTNANAFRGGFLLWEPLTTAESEVRPASLRMVEMRGQQ